MTSLRTMHESYHVDFEENERGEKVAILGPNPDCPYCQDGTCTAALTHVAEEDRRCECGHMLHEHAHGDDGPGFEMGDCMVMAPSCICMGYKPAASPSHPAASRDPILGYQSQINADVERLKEWAEFCAQREQQGEDKKDFAEAAAWRSVRVVLATRLGSLLLRRERNGQDALLRDVKAADDA